VTSAVKDWQTGYPNYGVIIWVTNKDQVGHDTRFASKSESDSTKHPYVVVNCVDTAGGAGGTTQPSDPPTLPTDDFHSF